MDPLHEQLIREAADAARGGDKETAFKKLDEVLQEDEENVPAWLLLARLTENRDEKRMALTTILQIDPNHQKARQLLENLDKRKTGADAASADIIPGVSRKQAQIIGGAIGGLILVLLIIAFVVISGNNQREADKERTATAVVVQLTRVMQAATQEQINLTVTADAATQTQIALVSPTPTPIPTSSGPTLPPTRTNTPQPSPTPTLAPIVDIPGRIIAWAGDDLRSLDVLPVVDYTVSGAGAFTTLPLPEGANPSVSPDGMQIALTVYNPTVSSYDVRLINIEGIPIPSPLDTAASVGAYTESFMPQLSADGTKLVFIGTSLSTGSNAVYLVLLDGSTIEGASVLQMTFDPVNYSYPSISPDGSRIVAVRDNSNGETPGIDLMLIDVATRALTPLTTDLFAQRETTPRWSPTGDIIAYASAAEEGRGTYDLYLIAPNNPGGSAIQIANSTADELLPVYSPDGRYLAFSSNRSGAYNIYIANLTGQQLYQLTDTRDEAYPGSWIR